MEEHTKRIEEVISNVFKVELKDIKVVSRLLGGMSNYTYLVEVDNKLFSFRIPGEKSEYFVNRVEEEYNLKEVEKLNINQKIYYLNTKSGEKLAAFTKGTVLNEIAYGDYLKEVAKALYIIHESGLMAYKDYDKLTRLNTYEKYNEELNFKHPNDYFEIKAKYLALHSKYSKIALTFTHGDFQPSNLVLSEGLILVNDWEFCAMNDPYYDIACFGNLDFNAAIKLLDIYLNRKATNEEFNRLIENRLFQTLQWYNVAIFKDLTGLSEKLKIDFKKVANNYLKKAFELNALLECN